MLSSLGHSFVAATPEAQVVIRLIVVVTLLGIAWLAAHSVRLYREWRLLRRVRLLCQSEPLCSTLPMDFVAHWASVGGPNLPNGWVTTRARELMQVGSGRKDAVATLRELTARRADRQTALPRYLAGTLVLLGLAGTVWGLGTAAAAALPLVAGTRSPHDLLQVLRPMAALLASTRTAFVCTTAGLVGTLLLSFFNLLFGQVQQALLLHLEAFSLTVLEPRILPSDTDAVAGRFARVLEESSQRFAEAIVPFAAGLDQFSLQLHAGVDRFVDRLENSSHNVLQCVEGMRQAATDLSQGTTNLNEYYARIEAIYRNIEAMAGQVAAGQAAQQTRLGEIAGSLHGVTESLTSVVAASNGTQAAVSRTAAAVAASADRLQQSLDMLTAMPTAAAGTRSDAPGTVAAPVSEEGASVTLRRIMEVQQQFIHTLDDRLARPTTPSPHPVHSADQPSVRSTPSGEAPRTSGVAQRERVAPGKERRAAAGGRAGSASQTGKDSRPWGWMRRALG
jgi:hypothetical protein